MQNVSAGLRQKHSSDIVANKTQAYLSHYGKILEFYSHISPAYDYNSRFVVEDFYLEMFPQVT